MYVSNIKKQPAPSTMRRVNKEMKRIKDAVMRTKTKDRKSPLFLSTEAQWIHSNTHRRTKVAMQRPQFHCSATLNQ